LASDIRRLGQWLAVVTVSFTLTRSEVCSCHRRLQARRLRHWTNVGFAVLTAALGVVASAPELIIFGAAYALIYVAAVGWIAPRVAWRRIPQIRAEQVVTVSDAGIHTAWTNASTSADWSFWPEVSRIGDAYVLHAKPRGWCVIPRRAFDSTLDEGRFRELVAKHAAALS
jgi:hypothetical protein